MNFLSVFAQKFTGISRFGSDSLLRLCTGQWAMSRPLFHPDPLFVPKPHKKNFEGPVSVDNITGLFIHIHLFTITSIPTSSFQEKNACMYF